MTQRYWAVVPAAGVGARMGAGIPKQYLKIAGRTVLEHVLERLSECHRIDGIVVAVSPTDRYWGDLALTPPKLRLVAPGGASRSHSVLNGLVGLRKFAAPADLVLVHDAARPCVPLADINRLIETVGADADGGLLALPVTDTVKRSDERRRVLETVPRERLWRAQTPQLFQLDALENALRTALAGAEPVTDEAGAMERLGFRPRLVPGSPRNIKITLPEDLELAAYYLGQTAAHGREH